MGWTLAVAEEQRAPEVQAWLDEVTRRIAPEVQGMMEQFSVYGSVVVPSMCEEPAP